MRHRPRPYPAVTPPVITSSDNCRLVNDRTGVTIPSQRTGFNRFQTLIAFSAPLPVAEVTTIELPDAPQLSRIIVQFTPDSTRGERLAYLQRFGGLPLRALESIDTYIVEVADDYDIASLPRSPIVVRAEPERLAAAAQIFEPVSDPLSRDQWSLNAIGAPGVWGVIPPDSEPVVVAVIDSGVCSAHPDLVGRIVPGRDFVDFDDDPEDTVFGHGCAVSGIIAANANNGIGVVGIAPNARIMPLRVLDNQGLGTYSTIAQAILYATDHGASIINLSLAGPNESAIVSEAIEYAAERGVTLVAATGNRGEQRVWFPASHPAVIAVGSIDQSLAMSAFSNDGPTRDVLAPGRNILSTSIDGGYAPVTGTSFAAPHVAAAVAVSKALGVSVNTLDDILYLVPPGVVPECRASS